MDSPTCLNPPKTCLMVQGLISHKRLCWACRLLSGRANRERWEILIGWMCLQFWVKVRARRQWRGVADTELLIFCEFPLSKRGLCPSPRVPWGRLWTGLPTSSLSQVRTNHHYHTLSSPHKYHIHMPSDPHHSTRRPAPTWLIPTCTNLPTYTPHCAE